MIILVLSDFCHSFIQFSLATLAVTPASLFDLSFATNFCGGIRSINIIASLPIPLCHHHSVYGLRLLVTKFLDFPNFHPCRCCIHNSQNHYICAHYTNRLLLFGITFIIAIALISALAVIVLTRAVNFRSLSSANPRDLSLGQHFI